MHNNLKYVANICLKNGGKIRQHEYLKKKLYKYKKPFNKTFIIIIKNLITNLQKLLSTNKKSTQGSISKKEDILKLLIKNC